MPQEWMAMLEQLGSWFIWGMVLSVALILKVTFYFLGSAALSGLAQENKIPYTWFSWIPVVKYHTLGSLSRSFGATWPFDLLLPVLSALHTFLRLLEWYALLQAPFPSPPGYVAVIWLTLGGKISLPVWVLLCVFSAMAIYPILRSRWPKQAALWAGLCVPIAFLRWVWLYAVLRIPPPPPEPEEEGMSWQDWLEQTAAQNFVSPEAEPDTEVDE